MPKHRVSEEHRAFAKGLPGRMLRAEEMLWNVLRAGRLDGWKFKRQVPFGRYIADFASAQARLIVELDGPLHDRPADALRDRARDAWFSAQGFQVLRLRNDLILASMELAVQRIRQALTAPSPGSLRSPPSPSGGEGQ